MAESNADQAFNGFLFTFPQKEHIKNEWRKKLCLILTQLFVIAKTGDGQWKQNNWSGDAERFVMVIEGCM